MHDEAYSRSPDRPPVPRDELHGWERMVFDEAERGEHAQPRRVASLCRSLAFGRQAWRDAERADPGAALEEAYRELSAGFTLLVQERRELDAQLASLRKQLASKAVRRSRKPPLTHDVVDEMRRLREERDDSRQAARDADGRYLALHRQMAKSPR